MERRWIGEVLGIGRRLECGRVRAVAVLATLLSLVLVPGARAQFVDEEPVGRLTIGGTLGVVIPSMSDVNENFDVANRFLARDNVRGIKDVNGALVTGLDVRYKYSDRISLGFNWGALNASRGFDVTRARTRFYTRTTTYAAYALYHVPNVEKFNERLQFYGGGGLLLLRNGYVEWEFEDRTTNFPQLPEENVGDLSELSGKGSATADGAGFMLLGGGSFQLSGRFSVAMDVGYRAAKLKDLEVDPATVDGFIERFGSGTEENPTEQVIEPGDWAIWDFFYRNPDAVTPDGRRRTDPRNPDDFETGTGCADCTLWYGDKGPIEIDYSGLFATISFRIHF